MEEKILGNKILTLVLAIMTMILLVVQLKSAKRIPLLYQSEIDRVEQQQRMNEYPPKYYRVANILEKRPESRIFFKLQEKFFFILDIKRMPMFLVPIMVIGLMEMIKMKRWVLILTTLVLPMIGLTLFGRIESTLYCLYPFLFISCLNGTLAIIKK